MLGQPTVPNWNKFSTCFVIILSLVAYASATCDRIDASRILAENENSTFVNPELDALLESTPEFVWDILAAVGIAFGLILAFFGLRMLWLTAFVCGAIVGTFASILVLGRFPDVAGETYLIVVAAGAIGIGLLVACLVKMSRFIVGIAIAIVIVGFAVQYGLIEAIGSNIGMWILLGICILCFMFLVYRTFEFGMIIASSFAGGVGVTLGLSRYLKARISIYNIYTNPSAVVCQVDTCYIVLSVGIIVALLGTFVQVNRKIAKNRRENGKANNQSGKNGSNKVPTYDETQTYVEKRISKIESERRKTLQAMSTEAKKEKEQQRKELGQLKETVTLVTKEREMTEINAAKDKQRIADLEAEIRATREAIDKIKQSESTPSESRLEELARQVDILTRLQEVHEQDKLDLAERNAQLQRQLEDTQRLTNEMVASRTRKASFAKSNTMKREEASIAASLNSERQALKRALEAAAKEQRIAREQASLAMRQVEELQLLISSSSGKGRDELAAELQKYQTRQSKYEADYQELQDVNTNLVMELGRLASETAEGTVVDSVDGDSEKPMGIPIDFVDDIDVEVENQEETTPAAATGLTLSGMAKATVEKFSAFAGYVFGKLRSRKGADTDESNEENTDVERGNGKVGIDAAVISTLRHDDARSVISFDDELEDLMEDQIDWKTLGKEIGQGLKELAIGFGLAILAILKALFSCSKYLANQAAESYRERQELKNGPPANINGKEWVSAFQKTG